MSFEDFPGGSGGVWLVVGRGWGKAWNKIKVQLQLGLQAAYMSLATTTTRLRSKVISLGLFLFSIFPWVLGLSP